jgi:osmotically-inducible protein OsmY
MAQRWRDEDRGRDDRSRYREESRGGSGYGGRERYEGGSERGYGRDEDDDRGGRWGQRDEPRYGPSQGGWSDPYQSGGGYGDYGNQRGGQYGRQYEGHYGGQRGDQYGGRYEGSRGGGSGAGDFGRREYGSGDFGQRYGEGGSGQYGRGRSGGGYGEGWGDRGRGGERGMWDRASDEVASWFGDEDAERRRRMDAEREGRHRGRGPKGYARSDERIREDVSDRLSDDPNVDASDIEVMVSNREVTLSGTVDSREARRRAEDCAEAVSGVSYVQNNLRVKQAGASTRSGAMSGATGTPGTSGAGQAGLAAGKDAEGTPTER